MRWWWAHIIIGIVILSACKVKMSLSGATIPPEAKTVSVEYFGNQTTIAGPHVPQKFTEKLRDVLQSQTNLSLVPKNGDLQFSGYVSDYIVSPVAIQGGDKPAQNRLTISVFVKYVNPYDPSKSFEQSFTRYADYDGTKNISEVENTLLTEIFRQLTEDIFNRAFNNW
ncbi:MAG: LPS assembly lipoprotein LptE [Bacteroidia bacterium]|nr:LPS assembly lipoprotein LptE [Bacteroidia bacterium]